MKQKIITFSKRFISIDAYGMNFDDFTTQLNEKGWIIKQIISTSFNHKMISSETQYPVLVITLLVEKP